MITDQQRQRRLARRARILDRARRRRSHPILRSTIGRPIAVNMPAMIDVVFLLLIYFMLIAEFRPDESSFETVNASASAESAADPFALPDAPITVAVRTQGDADDASSGIAIAVDSVAFGPIGSLAGFSERAIEAYDLLLAPDQQFVIEAESATRWAHTLAVFNALQLAGYTNIRLAPPNDRNSPIGGDLLLEGLP